ncbi:hypothetical protein OIU77_002387 [Salix suchowensis]|uniref:CBS domain-containing protein n=1 Tax=Salix suchowensis TaxID=1278906 RepID=A0ABQ9B4K0_9ROSI|nr:hypothetical protein OIU77_002387 [Salix suchowensis]
MAGKQKVTKSSELSSCDSYFENIQCRKKLPFSLQETLTAAFAEIPASSFPPVPGGKVIEILEDTSVADAVRILSERNIMAAPVRKVDAGNSSDWRDRYLGIIDYSAIVLWVLEGAELAAVSLSATSAAAAGIGTGAVGALGAVALGVIGPVAVAGLTAAAVGAAVAGGVAAEKGAGKDASTAADNLGQDFYKVLLQEEPFKSTTVGSIVKSYRWSPFLPVATNSSMLSILLLLSKHRLRNVPVIEPGNPDIQNFITQSAIVQGLEGCKGRDWFDCIAAHPISNVGLPFVSADEVVSVQSDELILEAFKKMKDNEIGGLPHTVMDFMNTVVSTTEGTGRVTPPITCKPDATLGSLVHALASKSVHRIHVVNQSEEVVGVITLRDVISCFVYEPPNHFDNYFSFSTKEMLND